MDSMLARGIALFLLAMGCGSSRQLVVITVHGDRTGVAALQVLVALDGKTAMNLESFAASTTDFGIELPEGARGALQIAVAGVDGRSCIISIAAATAEAGGSSRIDLTVTLGPVSPPKC
jgi:hypothetical protein